MDFRLASMDDLPQLKAVYKKIIANMDRNNIPIWDEIYPCEFFSDDIKQSRLYILVENSDIIAAFALCESCPGENCVKWSNPQGKALYIDRFGVNVDYARQGIGSAMLHQAMTLAKNKGAKYLRLFVVDINEPAIRLYTKNGLKRVEGIYEEKIDDGLILREYGFEIETALSGKSTICQL